jgi:parvulin-like peptidyl-prolyl isomerase
MKIPNLILTSLLASALLSGCGGSTDSNADRAVVGPAVISTTGPSSGVTVGAEAIPSELLDAYAARRGYDLKDPDQRNQAQEQLITLVALAQHAVNNGALKSPQVELDRLDMLSGYTIATGLAALPALDEATLKQRYDEQLAKIGSTEYRINHLLFRNGALAEQAAQMLVAGQPFAELLTNYRNNPEVPEASELPWIHLGRIPPQDEALANAIRDTPVGQASQQVIITPSGWHLIEVLETRAFTAPTFEALKDSIRQTEERTRRENLVKQIRAAAPVSGLKP